jgi:hypothetical protein
MSRRAILALALLSACTSPWNPTQLVGGYQIMIMSTEEAYVADADNELVLGPNVVAIGVAPGIIVVDCGSSERVVNGFAPTVGFNLIDLASRSVTKGLTRGQVEEVLRTRDLPMPEMRELSFYLEK